jgi:hypothetical protein
LSQPRHAKPRMEAVNEYVGIVEGSSGNTSAFSSDQSQGPAGSLSDAAGRGPCYCGRACARKTRPHLRRRTRRQPSRRPASLEPPRRCSPPAGTAAVQGTRPCNDNGIYENGTVRR